MSEDLNLTFALRNIIQASCLLQQHYAAEYVAWRDDDSSYSGLFRVQ